MPFITKHWINVHIRKCVGGCNDPQWNLLTEFILPPSVRKFFPKNKQTETKCCFSLLYNYVQHFNPTLSTLQNYLLATHQTVGTNCFSVHRFNSHWDTNFTVLCHAPVLQFYLSTKWHLAYITFRVRCSEECVVLCLVWVSLVTVLLHWVKEK